jgi:hypothetical protein
MELEYTPQPPKKKEAPKSEYVLVEDVTGKPIPKRGPQVLKAYTQDKNRDPVILEFKVPYPPKEKCKACRGRGYTGTVCIGGKRGVCVCKRCYPML